LYLIIDLDSCVSSIITAYLYSIDQGQESPTTPLVLPLINIPREDLNLRPDITYLLKQTGIATASLTFLDDLLPLKKTPGTASPKTILVDHNKLLGPTREIFGTNVIGIIDHHDDEQAYQIDGSTGPKIIERTGSCSSLVVNYFNAKLSSTVFDTDKDLALLALGPLLADTSNMTSRVEAFDTKSYEILTRALGYSVADVTAFHHTLDRYKKDVSSLTGAEILRKDYKEWMPESHTTDEAAHKNSIPGKIGISSVVKSLAWLYNTHASFEADIQQWTERRQLDFFAVMSSYVDDSKDGHDNFCRDILLYVSAKATKASKKKLQEVIKEVRGPLGLEPLNLKTSEGFYAFHQRNLKSSRKQVAPLLKFHIQGVAMNSL
jgi:exopolyphosphatase